MEIKDKRFRKQHTRFTNIKAAELFEFKDLIWVRLYAEDDEENAVSLKTGKIITLKVRV